MAAVAIIAVIAFAGIPLYNTRVPSDFSKSLATMEAAVDSVRLANEIARQETNTNPAGSRLSSSRCGLISSRTFATDTSKTTKKCAVRYTKYFGSTAPPSNDSLQSINEAFLDTGWVYSNTHEQFEDVVDAIVHPEFKKNASVSKDLDYAKGSYEVKVSFESMAEIQQLSPCNSYTDCRVLKNHHNYPEVITISSNLEKSY
jgi:hypothetical protein